MTVEYIVRKAETLCRRAGSRNPSDICSSLGIHVLRMDLQQKLKAYYFYICRISTIVVDENVQPIFEPVLIAHELGHAVLHRETARNRGFRELEIFGNPGQDRMEYEANLFAAQILIPDRNVLDQMHEYSLFEMASLLNVPPEVLDFKLITLRERGYGVSVPEISRADFLKKNCGAYPLRNSDPCQTD